MASDFKNFLLLLDAFSKDYDKYKNEYLAERGRVARLPGALNIYKTLSDFMDGGKKIRGFLVYLGFLVGGGKSLDKILPISLAVEIAHSFLLIHDDIIDKAITRRGKETVHKTYEQLFDEHFGVSSAIVIGDVAYFEAMRLVASSKFDSAVKVECFERFNDVLLETGYGELLDVYYSYRSATLSDVNRITDLKTARYTFVGPLTIGAYLGGAKAAQIRALHDFGIILGQIFQLKDDFLGVFGQESVIGKSILSDMQEGKNTLLIYKTKQAARAKLRGKIETAWGRKSSNLKDLETIRVIIRETGVYDWYEEEMRLRLLKSLGLVNKITNNLNLRKVIEGMATYVVEREK